MILWFVQILEEKAGVGLIIGIIVFFHALSTIVILSETIEQGFDSKQSHLAVRLSDRVILA